MAAAAGREVATASSPIANRSSKAGSVAAISREIRRGAPKSITAWRVPSRSRSFASADDMNTVQRTRRVSRRRMAIIVVDKAKAETVR